jgi:hypothetical protein
MDAKRECIVDTNGLNVILTCLAEDFKKAERDVTRCIP